MSCNGEVPPERYEPDASTVEAIAHWCWLYNALDHLWLDSNAYEEWAAAQLNDITSRVNMLGLEARSALHRFAPCYYYYEGHGLGAEDPPPTTRCPICGVDLKSYGTAGRHNVCPSCWIVTAAKSATELE
jgi:hypothetical protein